MNIETSKNQNSIITSNEEFFGRQKWNLPKKIYEYLNISTKSEERSHFDEVLLNWLSQKHAERTQLEYALDVRDFKDFMDYEYNDDLLLVKPKDAMEYILDLEAEERKIRKWILWWKVRKMTRQRKVGKSLIHRRIIALRGMYIFLKDYIEQFVDSGAKTIANPFKLIKVPKIQKNLLSTAPALSNDVNKLFEVITPDDPSSLSQRQSCERLKLMIALQASTGIRVSELLQCKIFAFEPLEGSEQVVYRFKAKWGVIRDTIIEYRLYNKLKAYADRYNILPEEYLFHPIARNPLNNRKDKAVSVSFYGTEIKKYAARAGISKDLKTHSFRSGFITDLHLDGYDIQEIKDAVGHASIIQTSAYVRAWEKSKIKASRSRSSHLEY